MWIIWGLKGSIQRSMWVTNALELPLKYIKKNLQNSLIHSTRRKAKRYPKESQTTRLAYQLGIFHFREIPQTRKPT